VTDAYPEVWYLGSLAVDPTSDGASATAGGVEIAAVLARTDRSYFGGCQGHRVMRVTGLSRQQDGVPTGNDIPTMIWQDL